MDTGAGVCVCVCVCVCEREREREGGGGGNVYVCVSENKCINILMFYRYTHKYTHPPLPHNNHISTKKNPKPNVTSIILHVVREYRQVLISFS